jgi:arsenate reductase
MGRRKEVLFVCMNNSARSQMAEGLLQSLYGDRYKARSAGVNPTELNPFAIRVMAEIGIDISKNRSKSIEEYRRVKFDYVVTVCDEANESCPFFPGKVQIHKGFKDPALARGSDEEILEVFREIRDEMREWIIQEFGRLDG